MSAVTISIDAELAWGFHDHPPLPRERIASARRAWIRLTELFDEYDVPAMWAVVGHLFLLECDGRHSDHPRSPTWFEADPGGERKPTHDWCGPELIQAVADADVAHEIGCHTFSHVEFRPEETGRETANVEIERCLDLAEQWDIDMESFVFPRNVVGHRDVLADHGFACYRGKPSSTWYDDTLLEPVAKAVGGRFDDATPPLSEPTIDEYGLVNVPASQYLFGFEGLARQVVDSVWEDPMVTLAKRGIDRAAREDGVFHLWLHPNNFTSEYCFERLDAVLAYLDERRSGSELEVKTMEQIAHETLDAAPGDADAVVADGSGSALTRPRDLLSAVQHHGKMGRRRARVEYHRLSLQLPPPNRAIDGDRAARALASASDVVVLCAGNICRSPMAERYLRRRLRERGVNDVTVKSAGFVRTEERSSPDSAVRAAAEYGVDLSEHRSACLTAEELSQSDVVFLMDAYNYDAMKRRFPRATDKTYFLNAVGPTDEFEIVDPHGSDLETFHRVYGQIADAVDRAADEMEVVES